MRTRKLTIENPRRGGTYDSGKNLVTASVAIEMECDDEADQTRALFALDAIWREVFTQLDMVTHNHPLPASDTDG